MEPSSDERAKKTRFRNATIIAFAVHCGLLLGISFEPEEAASSNARQIEVTLAHQPNEKAISEAKRLAQANQRGEDEDASLPSPPPAAALPPVEAVANEDPSKPSAGAIVTRANAEHQRDKSAIQQAEHLASISPELARVNAQLADLEATLDQQSAQLAAQPRVRRLTAVSAKQSVDAAYLLDWRRRLEAVGNKYYPEASVRYGIYGDVRLLVVILQDGSLEDVKVLSSSGYAVLDEAAIKVVRMAAPYSPFPDELKATTDKLEIIRTWQYLENQLSSG